MFPILGIPNKDGEPGLIGISGKAGGGKDTLGKYLCDEYQCLHYYFAKPLKYISSNFEISKLVK